MRTLPQWSIVRLIRRLGDRGTAIDAGTQAAALTYQLMLSLIPLVIFAGAVFGFVFAGDEDKADYWTQQVADAVPGLEEVVGRNIQTLVDARVSAGLLAVLLLLWTGSSLAGRCTHVIVRAFAMEDRSWIRRRVLALLEIVLVGGIALAGIVITSLTSADASAIGVAVGVAVLFGASLMAYVVFTPGGGPGWRQHVPGAGLLCVAGGLLTVLGGLYVQQVVGRATAVYGAVAAFIGLIAVLSLAANAFVYGAVLSAVLDAGAEPGPEPDTATT
jgi:uncharacterized BrkB/YihY/UPF0761 family membrane protein